jgi:hypothetical protein
MTEMKTPSLKQEEAHQLAIATWGQMYDYSLRTLVEKYGIEETLAILRPGLEKVGEQAPIFAQMMGIPGKDAITIGSLFCLFEGSVVKVEGKVTAMTPERVVKESYRCPLQGLSTGFCRAFTMVAEGMAKSINPEFKVTVTKMMTQGDPICEWIIEKNGRQ